MPCHVPFFIVRSHITGHRPHAGSLFCGKGLILICSILEMDHPERISEGVHRSRVAGDIEFLIHALNGHNIHGAICQAQSIGADIPCHGILIRPLKIIIIILSVAPGSSFSGQIRQRSCRCCSCCVLRVIRPAESVNLVTPGPADQSKPSAKPLIFCLIILRRQFPPFPEKPCGILAVDQALKKQIQLFPMESGGNPAEIFIHLHRIIMCHRIKRCPWCAHCLSSSYSFTGSI